MIYYMKIKNKVITIKVNEYYTLELEINHLRIVGRGEILFQCSNISKYLGMFNGNIYYTSKDRIISLTIDSLKTKEILRNYKFREIYLLDQYIYISEYIDTSFHIKKVNLITEEYKNLYSGQQMHSFFIQNDNLIIQCPYFTKKYIVIQLDGKMVKRYYDYENINIPCLNYKISYEIKFCGPDYKFVSNLLINNKRIKLEGRVIKYIIYNEKLYILTNDNTKCHIYTIKMTEKKISGLMTSNLHINNIFLLDNKIFYDVSDLSHCVVVRNNLLNTYLPNYEKKILIKNRISKINKCFYTIYKKNNITSFKGILFLLHGGPHDYIDKEYDELKRMIVESSYILVVINYHGSSTYGYEYEKVIHGKWGKQELYDIQEIFSDTILEYPELRHNCRILGISYGGILANLSHLKCKLPFSKVISISSPYDIKKFYLQLHHFHKNIFKNRAIKRRIVHYDIEEFNPINYPKDPFLTTIMIYIYGMNDSKIPMDQDVVTAIKNNFNIYLPVENAGHDLKDIFMNIHDKKELLNLLFD